MILYMSKEFIPITGGGTKTKNFFKKKNKFMITKTVFTPVEFFGEVFSYLDKV